MLQSHQEIRAFCRQRLVLYPLSSNLVDDTWCLVVMLWAVSCKVAVEYTRAGTFVTTRLNQVPSPRSGSTPDRPDPNFFGIFFKNLKFEFKKFSKKIIFFSFYSDDVCLPQNSKFEINQIRICKFIVGDTPGIIHRFLTDNKKQRGNISITHLKVAALINWNSEFSTSPIT